MTTQETLDTTEAPEEEDQNPILELHVTFDGKQVSVKAPGDPVLCMMILSDALKIMAQNFDAQRQDGSKSIMGPPQEASNIIIPGSVPVDGRLIQEAKDLIQKR